MSTYINKDDRFFQFHELDEDADEVVEVEDGSVKVLQILQGSDLVAQLPLNMELKKLNECMRSEQFLLLAGTFGNLWENRTTVLDWIQKSGGDDTSNAMIALMLDGVCELMLHGHTFRTKEVFVPKEVVPC